MSSAVTPISRGFAAVLTVLLACSTAIAEPAAVVYYVAVDGNDDWSGKLPAANAEKTDGPFGSIAKARDAIRKLKADQGALRQPVTVQVRAGTYFISETIVLGPGDSGTKACPISYTAYSGEKPVLRGGRPVRGWRSDDGKLYYADLAKVKAGHWCFRQLFVDGRRQVRARYPNVDPSNPLRRGFLYADAGGFGISVGCIHNRGDWMEYKINVPADGSYSLWVRHGSHNKVYGLDGMSGRTTMSVDGGEPIPLMNLPDTGGWGTHKWNRSVSLPLSAGNHVLKWQNIKGGGIDLDAFVLCDDPNWVPGEWPLKPTAPGTHRVLIQAEEFSASHGRQLRVSASGNSAKSKTFIQCKPQTAKAAWVTPDAEIHIFQSGSCRAFKEIVQIKSIDAGGAGIHVDGKECLTFLRTGDRFFVENVRSELDSPGEWFLDRTEGRLYYQPQKLPIEQSQVIAPVVGRLFSLVGDAEKKEYVSHVRISGFEIRNTDYSPDDGCEGYRMGREGTIYLDTARDCQIEDNRFVNIGTYAVCAIGSTGNQVSGNLISQSAEGGVLLVDSAGNRVSDNYIHHIGLVYKHVGGVVLDRAGCSDNIVAHNVVHDSSRYGITLKNAGHDNTVEYNKVYNVNTETYDTGGIEVTQQSQTFRSGSAIRHNIVHDTGGYSSIGEKAIFNSWGIYLDSYAGGYEVSHNIVWGTTHGGLMIQGGKDNYVHNNIFANSTKQQIQLNNFRQNSTGNRFVRNIVYYTEPEALLMAAYRNSRQVIECDHNLYWHLGGGPLSFMLSGGGNSYADWQKLGQDAHSVVADPRFVDPADNDYTLRPGSPALKLGFQPIDTSRVGLIRESLAQ